MDSIAYLSKPAPRTWIASRIYATLSHYFTPDHDADVVKMIADDWASILRDYPAWAIANACKWWMSRENSNHHRKPVPGDIEDRAHKEMEAIRAAKLVVGTSEQKMKREPDPQPITSGISEEERAKRAAFAASVIRGFGSKEGE